MEFLTFKRLISEEVLIVFYYLGAIGMPLAGYLMFRWIVDKLDRQHIDASQVAASAWSRLPASYRAMAIMATLAAFLFMQLFWRMLFEFLIAFLQMRDALVNH